MKNLISIAILVCLIIGCSGKKEQPLNQKIEKFLVSECRTECGIDSVGVWTNKIENNLNVKLGYIVNCSWKRAFLKNITETNDTLIVELDMPNVNGEYPITECDCFFFFEFIIKNYKKEPKAIRVAELFGDNKFWDERRIPEIEETLIETDNIKEENINDKEKVDSSSIEFFALKFINGYVEDCNKTKERLGITPWVNSNNYSTKNFKNKLETLIQEANKKDPEYGLGFDPIFDAQDYPEDGFELNKIDSISNYLTVKGKKNWKGFEITMKIKKENNQWLVDGCGVVNIPRGKQSIR